MILWYWQHTYEAIQVSILWYNTSCCVQLMTWKAEWLIIVGHSNLVIEQLQPPEEVDRSNHDAKDKYPKPIVRSLLTWCNPCSQHAILWHRSYEHITSSMNAACYQYSEHIMSTMNTSWYLATNHVIHDRIMLSISTLVYVMQSKPWTPNFINVLNTSSPNTYVIS